LYLLGRASCLAYALSLAQQLLSVLHLLPQAHTLALLLAYYYLY
jgi:hypothetical protein